MAVVSFCCFLLFPIVFLRFRPFLVVLQLFSALRCPSLLFLAFPGSSWPFLALSGRLLLSPTVSGRFPSRFPGVFPQCLIVSWSFRLLPGVSGRFRSLSCPGPRRVNSRNCKNSAAIGRYWLLLALLVVICRYWQLLATVRRYRPLLAAKGRYRPLLDAIGRYWPL